MANANQTKPISGAPETKPANRSTIWNENNKLVHPEMNAALQKETDMILGKAGALPEIPSDYVAPTPKETQALRSQTSDPITNPQPVSDPRTAPTLSDTPDLSVGIPERLPQFAPVSGGSEREAGKAEQEGVVGGGTASTARPSGGNDVSGSTPAVPPPPAKPE